VLAHGTRDARLSLGRMDHAATENCWRAEIAQTVDGPEEVDEEMRYLLSAVSD